MGCSAEPAVRKRLQGIHRPREELLHDGLPRELRRAASPVRVRRGDVVLPENRERVERHANVAVEVADEKRGVYYGLALGTRMLLRPAVEVTHGLSVGARHFSVILLLLGLKFYHRPVRRRVGMGLRRLGARLKNHHRGSHDPHFLKADLERILLLCNAVGNARPARLPLVRKPRRPFVTPMPPCGAARFGCGEGDISASNCIHLVADHVDSTLKLVAREGRAARGKDARLSLVLGARKLRLLWAREHRPNEPVARFLEVAALRPALEITLLVLIEEACELADVVAEVELAPCLAHRFRLWPILMAIDRHHADPVLLRLSEKCRVHDLRLAGDEISTAPPLDEEVALSVGDDLAELRAFAIAGNADKYFWRGHRAAHGKRCHKCENGQSGFHCPCSDGISWIPFGRESGSIPMSLRRALTPSHARSRKLSGAR